MRVKCVAPHQMNSFLPPWPSRTTTTVKIGQAPRLELWKYFESLQRGRGRGKTGMIREDTKVPNLIFCLTGERFGAQSVKRIFG